MSQTITGRDRDQQTQSNGDVSTTNPKKRPAPQDEDDDEDAIVDKLLPATTAMKRRRIEEERSGISTQQLLDTAQKEPEKKKPRKPKEINIQDAVRERREAEEEAARRDEQNLKETLDGMDISEMKNLAVIEEMEIPDRPPQKPSNTEANPRWDDSWNGRKNFKKFRRRGEGNVARRGATVMVPLEEVKKKDYGIGEDYWLESEKSKKQRKEKERTTQSQSQSQSQPFTTARSHAAAEVPAELAVDGDLPETIDVDAPRLTRHQEHVREEETPASGTQATGRKRPAPAENGKEAGGGVGARKKPRFAVQDSDSDSEDELKFRFRRGR